MGGIDVILCEHARDSRELDNLIKTAISFICLVVLFQN